MHQTMTYISYLEGGGAEGLRVASAPIPAPRPEEILIAVQAAGVNRPDISQRLGRYPIPADANPVLGLEVAGIVAAVGSNVAKFRIGDRVCALTNGGGYAEYCVAPASQCLPWPKGFDATKAAALPETYFTVWANLFKMGRLKGGETVLVHGGTSGIGTTAIMLAKAFGALVYATAGTAEKCEACVALGAAAAINYKEKNFQDEIRDLTDRRGVDVVLDIVGAPYFLRNVSSLRRDGRLLLVAAMGGAIVESFDLRSIMNNRLMITGSAMRPRTLVEKAEIAQDLLDRVWPLLDRGECAPVVHAAFPLAQAAKAHRLMESSAHIGKIVIQVSS